ncbi:hypothetical protein [Sunxiuqinia rutila]|uniref:hypothetical protein n=1 Tax=Sunxiuqinia rutila TaxID=1397841 RepID=UPI003D35CBA2
MKKFYLLAMLAIVVTIFSACQKDELIDEQLQTVALGEEKPDVYVENGYLVIQNFEAIDSLISMLQNKSLEEQSRWENQMGLTSAKIFRAEASNKLAEFDKESDAKNYANRLVKEGYFSMADSSLCYPFNNYSWDCILNKNGIIKIDDVLYCFQQDDQITVIDGKIETLNHFLNNPEACDTALIKIFSAPKLKSTIPVNYGTVASQRIISEGGGVRWSLSFLYDKITQQALDPQGHLITIQTGVKYYLYFHKEKKGVFGWRDSQGIFSHQHLSYNLGGNYDPIQGEYSMNFTNMTPATDYTQINTSELSNVYLDVKGWKFNGALSPIPSSYPGPAPIINNFSCNGKLESHALIINLTIN